MSETADAPVKICHLSDLHLPLPRPVPVWRLASKRILGYANLKLNRGKTHTLEAFEALLEGLAAEAADLVLITGDVANLSLPFEYAAIDALLRRAGLAPETTLVIPGNHDRYTPRADRSARFERELAGWLPAGFDRRAGYPICRRLGPVEVLALDTAVWQGPLRAAGRVEPAQLERLVAALDRVAADGRWPVIALHHPPFRLANGTLKHYRAGLAGCARLLAALEGRRATLLHGHLHRAERRRIGGLDVIGVPSASADTGDPTTQLAFNVYRLGAAGLESAVTVRCWPERPAARRFERVPLADPQ